MKLPQKTKHQIRCQFVRALRWSTPFLFLFSLCFVFTTQTAKANISYQTQAQVECRLQPASGSTGRVLVLINGIDTSAQNINEMATRWKPLTERMASIYSYFLYFSYNRDSATSYQKADTYQSILFNHVPLLHDLIESCNDTKDRSFDLIGYSLGGVVAMEYIKAYGFKYPDRVRHVITLDSPVNGVDVGNAPFLPFSGLAFSIAAQEVTTLAKSENTRYQNINMTEQLGKRGTEVWTLTNEDDRFIGTDAAINPVLYRKFKLGNIGLTIDASSQVGHNQILDLERFSEVANALYGILYSMPNSVLVTDLKEIPVLKPGERGVARIVIQNASIMPWPEGQTTLQHVRGPLFGRQRERPLPTIPASGQLELVINVQAPSFPGVYDSALKIAINGIAFEHEIPLSVVVLPTGSDAGLAEQIQGLLAQARQDLSQRFQETWDGLREQILAAIREEIARQIRLLIAQICNAPSASLVIAAGLIWRRRRREVKP